MKNLQTFAEFLNEGAGYTLLKKFLEVTLKDEDKGYYWIFTNNGLSGNKLVGNINDEGLHGRLSRSEVEDDLKKDEEKVNRKLDLLKKAIEEFNKENGCNLKFTYKLNSPKIRTGKWQGSTSYDAECLVANVTIQ
jgi:hypothetical protein